MSRLDILNAFSPAHEVIDPAAFAGRADQVRDVADALLVPGSVPVVYGDRGLGKSSLAVQAQLIAMGDTQLLNDLKAKDWILDEESAYLTFYVTCTDDVKSLDDLLMVIVHQLEDLEIDEPGETIRFFLIVRRAASSPSNCLRPKAPRRILKGANGLRLRSCSLWNVSVAKYSFFVT
jgi:hypothetical protein